MSSNSRKEFIKTNNKIEIEIQVSTILKLKYYARNVMSRKFKYRYIEKLPNIAILQIPNEYRKIFREFKSKDMLELSPD